MVNPVLANDSGNNGPVPGNATGAAYEKRRALGIRIAGIGFLLIVTSGIVDLLSWNIVWQVLTAIGLVLIAAGMWMVRRN